MSLHDGHRERLKERFSDHGLDNFNDLNALELLLFYAIPRKDTNEIAHQLLERFGSLDEVFSASMQQLQQVPGVGYHAAVLIRLVPQLAKRGAIRSAGTPTQFTNARAIAHYLQPRLQNEKNEQLLLLCLTPQKRLISLVVLSQGVVNNVTLNVRQLVEEALRKRASSVIIAHNHPTGNPRPSAEDEMMTRRVYDALKLVDITLADHIVIGGELYFSFQEAGLLQYQYRRAYEGEVEYGAE